MRIIHGPGRSGRGGARMSLIEAGLYTYTTGLIQRWVTLQQWPNGVSVEWEIDDDTRQPVFLYLTPATSGGLTLKKGRTGRPHLFRYPPANLGDLEPSPIQTVEETVTPTEIAIRIPVRALPLSDQAAE